MFTIYIKSVSNDSITRNTFCSVRIFFFAYNFAYFNSIVIPARQIIAVGINLYIGFNKVFTVSTSKFLVGR